MKSTSIMYRNEMHEVDGLEYCEWEDKIEGVSGDTPEEQIASYEWITYDFLMSKGYLVPEPKLQRPTAAPLAPIRDFSWDTPQPQREKQWSPAKVLAERAKVLNDREKLLTRQEKWLRSQEANFVRHVKQPNQFYHTDGRPYSTGNYITTLVTMFIIIGFLVVLAIICGLSAFAK